MTINNWRLTEPANIIGSNDSVDGADSIHIAYRKSRLLIFAAL